MADLASGACSHQSLIHGTAGTGGTGGNSRPQATAGPGQAQASSPPEAAADSSTRRSEPKHSESESPKLPKAQSSPLAIARSSRKAFVEAAEVQLGIAEDSASKNGSSQGRIQSCSMLLHAAASEFELGRNSRTYELPPQTPLSSKNECCRNAVRLGQQFLVYISGIQFFQFHVPRPCNPRSPALQWCQCNHNSSNHKKLWFLPNPQSPFFLNFLTFSECGLARPPGADAAGSHAAACRLGVFGVGLWGV